MRTNESGTEASSKQAGDQAAPLDINEYEYFLFNEYLRKLPIHKPLKFI